MNITFTLDYISDAFKFSPFCSLAIHHVQKAFSFPAILWIKFEQMDGNRKEMVSTWRQTVVTSPAHLEGSDSRSCTPSWNSRPNEESKAMLLGDSPGPDGLGLLSLDTPKRKAVVLRETMPPNGKVKLRKLSRSFQENLLTFQVKSFP